MKITRTCKSECKKNEIINDNNKDMYTEAGTDADIVKDTEAEKDADMDKVSPPYFLE
jgi:hypothetical protein